MQRISLGLVGPSTHTNPAHQISRTINLYLEQGDEGANAPWALFQTPGLVSLADLTTLVPAATEIRGVYVMDDRLFIVAGAKVIERVGAAHTVRATLNTSTGPVLMSDNNHALVLGDGTNFYVMDGTTYFVTEVDDGILPIEGYFSAYLDGRTYYLKEGSDVFAWSAIDDAATTDGLDFATAEGNPDPTVAMFIVNRELIFLGTKTTEFWGPQDNADNPVVRISGGFKEQGCAARFAANPFLGSVIFLSQDRSGHAQVCLSTPAGGEWQPISNHAVERDINQALIAYPGQSDLLRAYEYTEPGHKFWVLSLPTDKTWAFDLMTKTWHERAERDASTGLFKKIRQDVHAFWGGAHYVGGAESAVLYQQSRAFLSLAGDPLVRLRETSREDAQGRMMRFNSVIVDMSVGVGLDGDPDAVGADPQLMMQFSDDGGATWSNEITRSIGRIGEKLRQVKFGPCGMSRRRVFRFSVSDPVPVVFANAWADVDVAG